MLLINKIKSKGRLRILRIIEKFNNRPLFLLTRPYTYSLFSLYISALIHSFIPLPVLYSPYTRRSFQYGR